VWPIVSIILFAALLAVHLGWRRVVRREESEFRWEIEKLRRDQARSTQQVRARQEALFNSMAEGVVLLDHRGRIELANRAFADLFGVTSDMRSHTFAEMVHEPELAELVDSLSIRQQIVEYELKLSAPNERWLQVNGAAIFNGLGRRYGTILVCHDLTRLKQLERARTEFVANVSHELRTPLSLIQGYAETLLDGAKDNAEVAGKFLQIIERNTKRLRLLIEDLLTISELESGRVRLEMESVALLPLVEKVFEDFKAPAAARKVKLLNQVPDLKVRADAGRLEQVLGNLIDNAIKYGRATGKVTVGGGPTEDGFIEVFVQDDGPGIPPESLERVFERFYRVDKARSREQGGTGLGLSIVKHIVQSHRGRVWAKSEQGHGAAFHFTLPGEPKTVLEGLEPGRMHNPQEAVTAH